MVTYTQCSNLQMLVIYMNMFAHGFSPLLFVCVLCYELLFVLMAHGKKLFESLVV